MRGWDARTYVHEILHLFLFHAALQLALLRRGEPGWRATGSAHRSRGLSPLVRSAARVTYMSSPLMVASGLRVEI